MIDIGYLIDKKHCLHKVLNTACLLFVLDIVRKQISKRGIKVYMGITNYLHRIADHSTGLVNKYDLERALVDYHVIIPQDVSISNFII